MALVNAITTAETSVSATGAISGSLNTSALTATGMIKVRVRNIVGNLRIAIEDTANASAFSEALQVWTVDTSQGQNPDGNTFSMPVNQLPSMRFGATNTKLRANVQAISGSGSALVFVWLEQ